MVVIALVLALVLAIIMVVGMVPAMADDAATTTTGSITINSPIMGAEYTAYQVFEMTMNEAGDAFSYTIATTSPFYTAVKAYAEKANSGLTLTATNSDPNTFNVSADTFDAQSFGADLKAKIDNGDITGATEYKPTYEDGETAVTVGKSDAVTFEDLPLGYYLILSKYPETTSKVILRAKDEDNNIDELAVTKDMSEADKQAIINAFVSEKVTDAAVDQYINDNSLKDKDGNVPQKESDDWKSVKDQLIASTTKDAQLKIDQALNQIAASEADDNTLTQRLVFIDSTTPHADIIEKNEQHKWDVPVNPTGEANLEGLPDHGEPKGGKNIVIKEATKTSPAVYADWTEANVGDDIHYQLSINAVNFERTSTDPITVKQINEYIIADYENENMTFNAEKKLMVTIVKKEADGTVKEIVHAVDYTAWSDKFFKNSEKKVFPGNDSDILNENSVGLAIPWVEELKSKPDDMTNVTTTVEVTTTPLKDDEGNDVKDKDGNTVYETITHYWKSLYPNDVTILVDYYMTLNDTAVIDGNGNPNYSRYGVNFIETNTYDWEPAKPEKPEDRKPSELKERDDAKVYTYALAIHKVDQDKKDLAGAEFQIKGLTATKKDDGWYKVDKYNSAATDFTGSTTLTTDSNGLLVVEGLSTNPTLTIQETKAPEGYNKLAGTIEANATKLNETVTTSSKVTYFDKDGKEVSSEEEHTTSTTVITTIDKLKAIAIEVINNRGTELPSTGGIGTTIFYVAGSILVLAAAILLITKRRMSAED